MNKKQVVFTSLAALALASTVNTSFAEEVDATVAEPVVEAKQEAPVEAVAVEQAPAEEVAPVSETPAEEPALAAASAGEQTTPVIDVQAIVNGDYSSVVGTWVNVNGETVEITENLFLNLSDVAELADVVFDRKVSADGAGIESSNFKVYDNNGEFRGYDLGDGHRQVRIFIPAGTGFNGQNHYNILPDVKFVADQDTVLLHYMGGTVLASYSEIATKLYTRQIVASPATQEVGPTVYEQELIAKVWGQLTPGVLSLVVRQEHQLTGTMVSEKHTLM